MNRIDSNEWLLTRVLDARYKQLPVTTQVLHANGLELITPTNPHSKPQMAGHKSSKVPLTCSSDEDVSLSRVASQTQGQNSNLCLKTLMT